jgi:hypothetical protein
MSNQNQPSPDKLRMRVVKAKEKLPKNIIPWLIFAFPELNPAKVSNVLQLRTTDEEITKKIELLITKLKN